MTVINKSMNVSELNIQPPLEGKARLSDEVQQTLSILTAFGSYQRKALRCSESGVLSVASSRIKDILHYDYNAAKLQKTAGNYPCTECMVMAHPDNDNTVWVRPHKKAVLTNSWPLAKGEVIGFTIDNLNQLNMLFTTVGQTIIIAYTR
ncbi:unnamed protein product [marine sediment metagenome]|uniref:Uncharacterized protein n=1 Tax=marine sediment metagenome TaxID=412755 RepID=X1UHU8_9ZZZZ